ncbi:arylsulfatase [Mycena floridula]|nr:arylsulfatase [Mycena floridula]
MLISLLLGAVSALAATKPNVLFLFADDLDLHLGSLEFLPSVQDRIQARGITFNNHYATVALCCPSRVALLRGQHAHNTNITSVAAPGGGYDKWRLSGEDSSYLPHWLAEAGYRTSYHGKLMNAYSTYNYWFSPKGWDYFDGLLDPYTYIYNTPVFSINGARPVYYPQAHQTDVLRAKAADRLKELLKTPDEPWFLALATVAPHQQFNSTGRYPPVPATRHENHYPGLRAPRSPNFNPVVQKKPSWIGELPFMDDASISFSDDTYRRRAQSLKAVDEAINHLLDILEESGQLESTYIVFSSDHGYHTGNHRVPAGKTLPYREDTNVPFIISGPGIKHGISTNLPSSHVDLAPTFLALAGLDTSFFPKVLDGRSLVPYWRSDTSFHVTAPETVNIEFWGSSLIEATGLNLTIADTRNTYKTLRILGDGYGYLYSHWCTNETELYDTETDPYELNPLDLQAHSRLVNRLNGVLLVTKTCEKNSCRNPWKALHPDGTVQTLSQALHCQYDDYYANLPLVAFNECLQYQLAENEEPFFPGFIPQRGFGQQYRNKSATDGISSTISPPASIPEEGHWGAYYESLDILNKRARELNDEELA